MWRPRGTCRGVALAGAGAEALLLEFLDQGLERASHHHRRIAVAHDVSEKILGTGEQRVLFGGELEVRVKAAVELRSHPAATIVAIDSRRRE